MNILAYDEFSIYYYTQQIMVTYIVYIADVVTDTCKSNESTGIYVIIQLFQCPGIDLECE